MSSTPKKQQRDDPFSTPPSSSKRQKQAKNCKKSAIQKDKKSPLSSKIQESAYKSPKRNYLYTQNGNDSPKMYEQESSPLQRTRSSNKKSYQLESGQKNYGTTFKDSSHSTKHNMFSLPVFSSDEEKGESSIIPFSLMTKKIDVELFKINKLLSGVVEENTPIILESDSSSYLSPPQSPKKGKNIEYSQNEENRFDEDFQIIKRLGSGYFGTVFKCLNKLDGNIYAVKVTKQEITGESSQQQILREANTLAALSACGDGEYIVRYHNAWIEDRQLHLMMECCEGNIDCYEFPSPIYSSKFYSCVRKIFSDVVKGLHYLHSLSLAHLDLKPENILYNKDQNKFKIADLGLALISQKNGRASSISQEGDIRFLASEILNFYEGTDLKKADIFSLGATLYQIITQSQLPKNGEEWQQLRSGKFHKLDLILNCPKNLKVLIQTMMHPDPELRPSTEEILNSEYMKSELVNEIKWQKILKNIYMNQINMVESAILKSNSDKKEVIMM